MAPDEQTLFDLMAAINDHRRSLDATAFGPGDPARRAQCRCQSKAAARTIARITRTLAERGKSQLSSRELESYVDSLINVYADDSMDHVPKPDP